MSKKKQNNNQPLENRMVKCVYFRHNFLKRQSNNVPSLSVCMPGKSCLTLCDPVDCSPPGSSVHGDSSGKNTRVGCHALLQGILLTQESNPNLLSLVSPRLAGRIFTTSATWEVPFPLYQAGSENQIDDNVFHASKLLPIRQILAMRGIRYI